MAKLTTKQREQIDNIYEITKYRTKESAMTANNIDFATDASELNDSLLIPPGEEFGETHKTADMVGLPIQIISIRTFEVADAKEVTGKRVSVVARYVPLSGNNTDDEEECYLPTRMLSRLNNFFMGHSERRLNCRIFKDPYFNGVQYKGYQIFGLDQIPEDHVNRRLAVGAK